MGEKEKLRPSPNFEKSELSKNPGISVNTSYAIGIDISDRESTACLVVCKINKKENVVDVINAFYGDEAFSLYNKLISNNA